MQVVLFALVLALLLCEPVHSLFTQITFSSIAQCGSFQVNFTGGSAPTALPLSLTILPFNSTTPIVIPIPLESWNETTLTGAAVTFVPFLADTQFIASLDDAEGNAAGSVSDVIRILPSEDRSCISNSTAPTRQYTTPSEVSQCQPFTVDYDQAVHPDITVRTFIPRGTSLKSAVSGDSPSAGNQATFIMDAFRGRQVLLLISDGKGVGETSSPLTVGGDSSSSNSCLRRNSDAGGTTSNTSTAPVGLSKNLIIIIGSTVGGVFFLASSCMVLYLLRDRRRRLGRGRQRLSGEDDGRYSPDRGEKGINEKLATPTFMAAPVPSDGRIIQNTQPYATSPTASEFIDYNENRRSEGSWVQKHISVSEAVNGVNHVSIDFVDRSASSSSKARRPSSGNAESISSLDIEHILDMATIYGDNQPTAAASRPVLPPVNTLDVPRTRGRGPVPSDVTVESGMFNNMVYLSPNSGPSQSIDYGRANAFPTSMAFPDAEHTDYTRHPESAVVTTRTTPPLRILTSPRDDETRISSASEDSSVVNPQSWDHSKASLFTRYTAEEDPSPIGSATVKSVHQRALSKTGYNVHGRRPSLPSSPRPSGRFSSASNHNSPIESPTRALTRDSAASGAYATYR